MKEGRFYGMEQRKLTASLVKRQDFSVDAVFNTLCNYSSSGVDEETVITFKSLAKFFRRNGFYASAEDVGAIIRRMDLNYDGQICRDELGKFLQCISGNSAQLFFKANEALPALTSEEIVEQIGRELRGSAIRASDSSGIPKHPKRGGTATLKEAPSI